MNERIEELSNQAYDYASAKNSIYSPQLLRDYTEKFAELIVRECAGIAKHHVMNISTYADADFVDEHIKKHFGVE